MSSSTYTFPGVLPADQVHKKHVRIHTNQGDMVVELDQEKGPCAASNFISLVKAGFYNGTIFHRVIPGFMIQGGDPTGTGMGGPGYEFQNDAVTGLPEKEFNMQGQRFNAPYYADGVLAMANAGRDTNGSQFFIMVDDYPLSPDYSIFGRIVEGLDVAKKISKMPGDRNNRPSQEVKMLTVTVE
jgi:cyclophilin family peptidyl-prolyl cis-trans isomerase